MLYLKKLEELISANASGLDKIIITTLFDRYKEVSKNKPLATKLDDAQVYNIFINSNENEEFYYDLISMRIAKLSAFNASYIPHFEAVLKKTDSVVVKKVAERLEYYINYGDILLGLSSFNQYPLFAAVANELTKQSYGSSKLAILSILSSFNEICNKGNIEPNILITRISAWDAKSITFQNIKKTASIYFFETAVNQKDSLSMHCIECVREYLTSLSVEQWQGCFKDFNSYEFKVSHLLNDYKFPQNAIDAIKYILKEIATLNISIPNKESWNELISKLKSQGRSQKTTFNTIRDSFCREDNMSVELFNFFGDWLFEYADLDKKQESLRTIFTSDVIRNVENLELIINNNEKIVSIVNAADDEALDFKDTIRDMLKNNGNDKFIKLAESIGVNKINEESDLKIE